MVDNVRPMKCGHSSRFSDIIGAQIPFSTIEYILNRWVDLRRRLPAGRCPGYTQRIAGQYANLQQREHQRQHEWELHCAVEPGVDRGLRRVANERRARHHRRGRTHQRRQRRPYRRPRCQFNALATGSTYVAQVGQDAQNNLTVGHALTQVNTTGDLVVSAGRDLTLSGAQLAVGGNGALLAGRALTVASVMDQVKTDQHGDALAKNYDKRAADDQTVVGSSVSAGGALQLAAGIKETAALTVSSSALASTGALSLSATGNVLIGGVQENHVIDNASHHESSSTFKSKETTTADYSAKSILVGSSVSGNSVAIQSGNDIRVVGSGVVADMNVDLVAKNSVTITAGTSTSTESHHSEVVEGGFLSGGGGFGISYGTRTTTTDQKQDATLQSGQARSLVGSLGGSLNVIAGERVDIAGSDVSAAKDIMLVAKSVSITPGQDQVDGSFATKRTQDGLTLAVGGTVVNAIQTMQSMGSAASETGNGRIKALAAATAAKAAADAGNDIAQNGVSVSVSLTAGHSESEQKQTTASTAHLGSTVSAGNDLTIIATGGGKASNIDIIGSDIGAKNNVTLLADNQVNLLAAQDTDSQHSVSKSLSAAAGVAASYSTNGGMAAGFTASVGAGRGSEDGEGVTQINSHVSAGEKLTINSGGDTNIKGAVASGNQVVANVGGNLNIESLQDKATFDSKNVSANASAIVGYGASVSGGVNASKIQSDYASVQEQSALRAGDGGFQVNVAGNTDFKGAVISSTASGVAASSLVTGSLTHSDIENYSKMSAASVGVGGSVASAGAGNGNTPGDGGTKLIPIKGSGTSSGVTGLAATSDNASSKTRSGVGAGAVVITNGAAQQAATGQTADQVVADLNRNVVTGTDTSGRIGNSLDVRAVNAELEIASAFGSSVGTMLAANAAKTVGDIGEAHRKEAEAAERDYTRLADQAANSGDASEAARYSALALEQKNTAAAWGDNGVNRIALHAGAQGLIGGLTGGSAGAVSSVSGVVGGNVGQQLGEYLGTERANALGLTDAYRAALVNSYQQDLAKVGGLVAGLSGAEAGGVTGLGAVAGTLQGGGTATTVDSYNRQLHLTETQKLALLKSGKSATEQHRLDAAACALVKCAAGVPATDPLYAQLAALQIEGSGYSSEIRALKSTGEFIYKPYADKFDDLITSNNEAIHRTTGGANLLFGSLGTVGGAAMATGGTAACPVSLGAGCGVAVLGMGIAGMSAKQAVDGNAALWGSYASTEGARVLASFGTSTYPGEANPVRDAAIEAAKIGVIALAGKYIPKALSAAETQITKVGAPSTTIKGLPDELLADADFAGQLAGRPDMVEHLTTAKISGKQISGGHDLNTFNDALAANGGAILGKPKELAPGIFYVEYSIKNSEKSAFKTVYDPTIYPNMPSMTVDAVNRGLVRYQIDGNLEQLVVVNGVQFNVQVSLKPGSVPSVRTAYPVGLVGKGK
jgi:hypothetical protein